MIIMPKLHTSNIAWEVIQINEDVLSPLIEHSEGVYSLEYMILDGEIDQYVITPSTIRDTPWVETVLDYDMLKYDRKHLHCYTIELVNPSFLPLYVEECSLWEDMMRLNQLGYCIFSQFLFSKSKVNYRELFLQQYAEYLRGNDSPSTSKIGRKFQSKLLNVMSRIGQLDLTRQRKKEIDDKVKDINYRFEWRLIIYSNSLGNLAQIEREINDVLSEMDSYNQLRLFKVRDKEQFIADYGYREFTNTSKYQLMCETELLSLFVGDGVSETSEDIVVENKPPVRKGNELLDILPQGKKKNIDIDHEIEDRIIKALRRVKIINQHKVDVIDHVVGATIEKVTLSIPPSIKYSAYEKSLKDMKSALGCDTLTIEQGDEADTVDFVLPVKERQIVYLRDILESSEFTKAKNEFALPWVIGLDTYGKPLIVDLAKLPHLLVAGATGGGKSVFITVAVMTLLMHMDSSELNVYLVDPKKVEFASFRDFPQTIVETDMTKAVLLFDKLVKEMDKRYELFSEVGVRNIESYNKKFPNKKVPYIVTVVDEMADLMMLDKGIEDYIVRLSQLARAAGIHLVIATQRPDKDVVTGIIKSNIESRIAFSVSEGVNSRIILDQNGAEQLLGNGDGLAKIPKLGNKMVRFQSGVITLDEREEERIFAELKKRIKGDKAQELEEVEVDELSEIKRVIARSGETRIVELQKEMKIRINDVSRMVQELVEEGWLKKEGRKYEINVGDDELDEWR